jgi:hypothetical protein
MLSGKPLLRIAVLLALAMFLPGCAAYHCNALPDREQCYAAYDQYESCQANNRWLIRQVGEKIHTTCRSEPPQCNKKGKCYRGYETCDTRHEPIYDYRDYNRGVSACMRQQGLANYDSYFNRPLF